MPSSRQYSSTWLIDVPSSVLGTCQPNQTPQRVSKSPFPPFQAPPSGGGPCQDSFRVVLFPTFGYTLYSTIFIRGKWHFIVILTCLSYSLTSELEFLSLLYICISSVNHLSSFPSTLVNFRTFHIDFSKLFIEKEYYRCFKDVWEDRQGKKAWREWSCIWVNHETFCFFLKSHLTVEMHINLKNIFIESNSFQAIVHQLEMRREFLDIWDNKWKTDPRTQGSGRTPRIREVICLALDHMAGEWQSIGTITMTSPWWTKLNTLKKRKWPNCSFLYSTHFKNENRSGMSDSLWPHELCSPWNSPGQNTGVGSLSLLQGIFPTQGSNPGLLHCRQIFYQLNHKGSPSTHSTKPQNRMFCPQWTKMPALLPRRKSHGKNLATSGRPSRGDLYGQRAVKFPFGK